MRTLILANFEMAMLRVYRYKMLVQEMPHIVMPQNINKPIRPRESSSSRSARLDKLELEHLASSN